jgi:hypothetical protein
MSDQDQEAYRDQIAERIRYYVQMTYDEIYKVCFKESFSLMDLLFLALAVITAYRIAVREFAKTSEPVPEGETDS